MKVYKISKITRSLMNESHIPSSITINSKKELSINQINNILTKKYGKVKDFVCEAYNQDARYRGLNVRNKINADDKSDNLEQFDDDSEHTVTITGLEYKDNYKRLKHPIIEYIGEEEIRMDKEQKRNFLIGLITDEHPRVNPDLIGDIDAEWT